MDGFEPMAASARLEVEAMRTALAIAETGSVTRAAERIGRTPAAVSMQLRKLEETLGRRLFERARSGMRPTAEGERLLPHARRLIDAERAARDAFMLSGLQGRVRIGVIEDFGCTRLAEVLRAFSACHPDVVVEAIMGPSRRLGPMLDDDELDLAVISPGAAVEWRADDQLVNEEPLVWATGRTNGPDPWAQRPIPIAVTTEGCAWRRASLNALDRAGLPYRVVFRSDFGEALIASASAGLSVTVLPLSRITDSLRMVGEDQGAPSVGTARMAMRLGPSAGPITRALADRIAERLGAPSDALAA